MAPRSHVVLSGPPPQGHLRGLCIFAAKLAVKRDTVVTLLLPNGPKTFAIGQEETARVFSGVEDPKGELRIVAFGEPFAFGFDRMATAEKDSFTPVWELIASEKPIKCSVTGKEYAGAAKPKFVAFHPMQYALYEVVRELTPSTEILAWKSNTVAGIAQFLLPPSLGGVHDDMLTPFTPDEIKNGRPYTIEGRLLELPGLPPLYDYELHPQDCSFFFNKPGIIFYMANLNFRGLAEADGILSPGGIGHDSKALVDTFSAWAQERKRDIYFLGPVRPFKPDTTEFTSGALEIERENCPPGVATKVTAFLDKAFKAKGKNSVVYISFGSMFWPVGNPEHLWAFIDALIERGIPFLLSHPSPLAKIPERLQREYGLEGTGNGLMVPWAPQHTVLSHEAIGWMVNQGGAGGTMDALTQGVPMIAWPFLGDQPPNVAQLVHTADVAFEFTEVRTGEYPKKPSHATGRATTGTLEAFKAEVAQVLDDMAGEVGARKRANAQAKQKELAAAWSAGGPARSAFEKLVAKYGL